VSGYCVVHEKLGIPWTGVERVVWRALGYVWVAFFMMELTISPSYGFFRCIWELE
jgi:hypothetical protein